ncbi:TauD/TfdA family dioxygenase [Aeromicrobium sp. NPDC092404]|uniref:TauD/TfdA dioxygenase family protein n=1 Tax=Aeromicrobium sp. NPDC092404 TaxID=3154976 RepID=UPI0034235298
MTLSIRKLSSRIGAEISGVDLSAPLDPETIAAIRHAVNTHKAIVFDGANLDQRGQERLAGYFGDLTTAHPTVPAADGSAAVLAVDSTESKANQWHTDVTFVVNPPAISTLRSITVPPYGGETLIADAAGAYRDLPPALRTLADGLWAVHSNDYDYAVPPETLTDHQKAYNDTFTSTVYEAAHPVVRVHPETGERGLFIGGFVRRLVGLSSTESRDLLRLLQAYVTRPENILRWSWSPGQLLIFDNRITQHYAIDNYDDQPRRLERITVAGDVPVSIDGTPSYAITGDSSHYSTVAESRSAA